MKIKIISLNIFEGGLYFKSIKKFITKESPDIVCLQEVYNSKNKKLAENLQSIEIIKSILASYFYSFAPELTYIRKEGRFPCGNAIFSKFPITKTKTTFFDIPYGEYKTHLRNDKKHDFSLQPNNLQHAEINVNSSKINIFNIHGIWGFHGKDTDRRLKMGQKIIDNIKDKDNVILAGDFNLFPTTQTIRNIKNYLKSVFDNTLKTTFNTRLKPHPGNYSTSVVDMVFISNNIEVLEKYCPDVDVSDHFPLVCTLNIPD